ncbi:uncharacterized protein MEPE_06442 [Melanopsichium pennsylvanicum]|uniref:Uncharacterized protein n=2 Tax=Melanopsichium pennsylvanicum TaxID=63383 RepID=A0AAJ4XTK2_9BASI|nr:membrane protein [Melanopsichium pennsylvanicum 4]SNX87732.1 uncharacterized protein MEPE_06442 [Melanopsichium pennsylvanicum]
MSTTTVDTYPVALAVASYLGYNGYKKGSLSQTGAITAALVGYANLANPYIGHGLTLICFYLTGSRATKYKANIKAQLEAHSSPTSAIKVDTDDNKKKDVSSGNRSAIQVLCNSATATLACIVFRKLNSGFNVAAIDPLGKEMLKLIQLGRVKIGLNNLLLTLIVGGHYAACLGDTLASELGILSKSQPRLITNPFRVVPKGTNGGVSTWGLFVSAIGGALIGVVQSVCIAYHYYGSNQSSGKDVQVYAQLTALLTAAGLVGSLIDSVLGATLQQTLVNKLTKRVLVNQFTDAKPTDFSNGQWTNVSGYNLLSNNGVNFVASAITALGTAWFGLQLF